MGLLPLNYNGDIKYLDNYINNIKAKYNIFDNILNNYSIKYKRKYFLSGEYNYNELPPDCQSNRYLENYNLYMKQKLGKKFNLSWQKFINFIKSESKRTREKLTINADKNIKFYSKFSKFKKIK